MFSYGTTVEAVLFLFWEPKSRKSFIKIGRMYKKSDTLLDNLTKQ